MVSNKPRKFPTRLEYARNGLIAVIIAGLALALLFASNANVIGGPETIKASVANAGGSLLAHADVKVNGVIIGSVEKIERDPDSAGVLLEVAIEKDDLKQVPSNVVARVLPATVFGTSYLDLTTGGQQPGPPIKAGAVVPADTTQETLELQQALDDVDALVDALGPEELASALGSAAQALDGRGEKLGEAIDTATTYLSRLNNRMPIVRDDLRKLAANLTVIRDVSPDLLAATRDGLDAAQAIVKQQASIAAIISGGTKLADESKGVLDANRQHMVKFIKDSATLLNTLYVNRRAGITEAVKVNTKLRQSLATVQRGGKAETHSTIPPNIPPYYQASDCANYGGGARGDCGGSARVGFSSMLEAAR